MMTMPVKRLKMLFSTSSNSIVYGMYGGFNCMRLRIHRGLHMRSKLPNQASKQCIVRWDCVSFERCTVQHKLSVSGLQWCVNACVWESVCFMIAIISKCFHAWPYHAFDMDIYMADYNYTFAANAHTSQTLYADLQVFVCAVYIDMRSHTSRIRFQYFRRIDVKSHFFFGIDGSQYKFFLHSVHFLTIESYLLNIFRVEHLR